MNPSTYKAYVAILEEELIPATGCTEPIAVALASAIAADALGSRPVRCRAIVSGNIVKNVNSVVVPNTGGLRGIKASVAAGVVKGNPKARLEVLADIEESGHDEIRAYLQTADLAVELADSPEPFYVEIAVEDETDNARVIMERNHTHIARIERNGEVLFQDSARGTDSDEEPNHDLLNFDDIMEFVSSVDLDDVREVLDRQIDCNYAIAQEGLRGDWGARVGKTYLASYDDQDVLVKAKAAAAAGSDARMSGCPMPVVIVSGSGNQGITASVPLVVYAHEYGKTHDELLRALVLSDLIAIYQKTGIGCLSAYCGAVCAGTAAAAGIVYLMGGSRDQIMHTVVNSLGIISGMVCDGAKPSCAAKIAAALESGMFGFHMYQNGNEFFAGDGIVTKGIDQTISNVSRMARDGMRETDREILQIMIGA